MKNLLAAWYQREQDAAIHLRGDATEEEVEYLAECLRAVDSPQSDTTDGQAVDVNPSE